MAIDTAALNPASAMTLDEAIEDLNEALQAAVDGYDGLGRSIEVDGTSLAEFDNVDFMLMLTNCYPDKQLTRINVHIVDAVSYNPDSVGA